MSPSSHDDAVYRERAARPEMFHVIDGQRQSCLGRMVAEGAHCFTSQDVRVGFGTQIEDELTRIQRSLETKRSHRF